MSTAGYEMPQGFDPKHPDLGWQTAIPEPFWTTRKGKRRWWGGRERVEAPACYPCRATFKDRAEYGAHYLRVHTGNASSGDAS
jgi:hypothetical protein